MISYSQRGQDLFVESILSGQKNGYFLDFGCRGPIDINNTYLFEKHHNFTGLSFDYDSNAINEWNSSDRNYNNAKCIDLLDMDSAIRYLDNFYSSNIIDYFSFDLEPPLITLDVLKKFPFDKYKFKVITYEHDFYRGYDTLLPSRDIFIKNGYVKVTKEYMHIFDITKSIQLSEDWWINPEYINISSEYIDNNIIEKPSE